MACTSCKEKANKSEIKITSDSPQVLKLSDYIFRVFTFIIAMIILPLMYPFLVFVLFKKIILGTDINLMPMLLNVGKTLKREPKTEYIDINSINEDDYELVDVDEIK